jgi:Uri superfamily endonuclease
MEASQLKQQLGDGSTGTYILCLYLPENKSIRIGRLGSFNFDRGYYFYVGSAFGPGGIAARCGHHLKTSSRPRWHMDYLRRHCRLQYIVFSTSKQRLEHRWANKLQRDSTYSIPVAHFGASDCSCAAHLFYSAHSQAIENQIKPIAGIYHNDRPQA